jgi:uncharacterized membrane protein YczE
LDRPHALAAQRSRSHLAPAVGGHPLVRWAQLLTGLAVMGTGIAAFVQAGLGLGPWDVLHQGIARRTGLPLGTVVIVVGAAVMLLWWPLRQRLGPGSLANVVGIGVTIDLVLPHLPEPDEVAFRTVLMLLALVLVGLGSSMYLGADLGAGPRDGVMTGLHRRFGISIRLARTAVEVTALAIGVALGGTAGIGTVVFALGIGPLVQRTLPWFGFPVGASRGAAHTHRRPAT